MNRDNLRKIFANYIRKFEFINNPDYDENYKWRIAAKFHDLIDPDSPDFGERIKVAWKESSNLIDSSNRYCFSALVSCAEHEPESVRLLFKALFADDGGDLSARQKKIQTFIADANALTARLHSTNNMFMNDQRSTMAYLFLYDPDHHYLYKASEANDFASCIEFYDDWGPGTDFHLDAYYRMCDQLVEEIKQSEELLETHRSRYVDAEGNPVEGMHPDVNYHILVFDIIYGAPDFRYNFYEGIPFTTITASARKLHQERVAKANQLHQEMVEAQKQADKLKEAKAYFDSVVVPGLEVIHKSFGTGVVESVNGPSLAVHFPERNETKKFMTYSSFVGGFLQADIQDLYEKSAEYKDVVMGEAAIDRKLKRANVDFQEYQEFYE